MSFVSISWKSGCPALRGPSSWQWSMTCRGRALPPVLSHPTEILFREEVGSPSWSAWPVPLTHSGEEGDGRWRPRCHWVAVVAMREAFPRPYLLLRMLHHSHVLGLWGLSVRSYTAALGPFCFYSLTFREMTSFGFLTTNSRWETSFLIHIFRVKSTFSLAYNQRTCTMEIVL